LVAGTGCNAATGQFALRPLISAGVIDLDQIIIDLENWGVGRRTFGERKSAACGAFRRVSCLCGRAVSIDIWQSLIKNFPHWPAGR
jgi:hypothetical protein